MTIPFKAKFIQSISTFPMEIDEIIEIVGVDDEESCEYDKFVQVKWKDKETLGVPLKQLKGINVDDKTK
ncbi:hypothetical protein DB41_DI00030 [Neochlamydia sp. TUME1]|nr:hypothetical protein DB41_DI00030 [Neochlamydia sp. TUME1]